MISAAEEKILKISTLLLETIFIVITILTGIRLILFVSVNPIEKLNEFIGLPDFSWFLGSLAIVIFAPSILAHGSAQSAKFINKFMEEKFRTQFFNNEGNKPAYNLLELSVKYRIPKARIKELMEHFVSDGLLRGRFEGFDDTEEFVVEKDFEVKTADEKRKEIFDTEILEFLKPYKVVSLQKIAHAFKLSHDYVEKQISKLILDKKIIGFIDNDSLFRDLGVMMREFSELDSCKYCYNKILKGSDYCSFCGKPTLEE
jgi:hypothetical protein